MYRLIYCSRDFQDYTQEELKELYDNYSDEAIEAYALANLVSDEVADKYNFYNNSIGMFEESDAPDSEPDYISYSGSEYWYTPEGVYRRSDHWGSYISSCSWYFWDGLGDSDEVWYNGDDDQFDEPVTGFIRWSDLKPKGEIIYIEDSDTYELYGFKFDSSYFVEVR